MSKPLSEDLVKQKTKQDSLHLIRNLNLWGQDIDDLRALRGMPNLEVLSLSINKIATLRDITHCRKLKELYLRKNLIADIQEIRFLSTLLELKVLWLSDNPCANVPNYRFIVIRMLPSLEKLDNIIISEEEKSEAEHLRLDFENESRGSSSFQEQTSGIKTHPNKGASQSQYLQAAEQQISDNNSNNQHNQIQRQTTTAQQSTKRFSTQVDPQQSHIAQNYLIKGQNGQNGGTHIYDDQTQV